MAYLGEEIKKLGFGLMRLPQKSEGVIDVEQTKVMVDKFMEAGFTYFDTAWAYAGSEDAIREALVERYPREKYQLATKMAAWINCKTRDEALAQFKTSLERTKAGYFDFYLLHNLGEHRTKYFDEYGLWDWIREQKEAGLIKHAGFSFHSTPEELEAILKNAEVVVEDEVDLNKINVGCAVKVYDITFDEEMEFKIVGSTEANSLEGKISNESPVGHALIGKKINDVVDVETQAGVIQYKVLDIKRS